MLLKKWRNIWNTLAFRLTFLYAVIFFISTFVALFVVYLLSASIVIDSTDQDLLNEHLEFVTLYNQKGLEAIKTAAVIEGASEGPEGTFYRIFNNSGAVLASSDTSTWSDLNLTMTGFHQLGENDELKFLSLKSAKNQYGIRIMNARIGPDLVLQMGVLLEKNAHFIEAFRKIFSVSMIVVLFFAAVVGWFLAKKALTGVAEVIHDTIPQFSIFHNKKATKNEIDKGSANDYGQRYMDFEKARNYNLKYERKPLKRLSSMREYQILGRLLGQQRHCKTMLEIPCGGGRISSQLTTATDLLIEADIGLGQVLYGMSQKRLSIPQVWMTASAFYIPFRDESVDAAICVRLSHHLTTMKQREHLLGELLRVARRYVIVTFFDHHSIKNNLRRLRKAKPKLTMTLSKVSSVAAAHAAELVACPRLSIIGSGHRYALLVKAPLRNYPSFEKQRLALSSHE